MGKQFFENPEISLVLKPRMRKNYRSAGIIKNYYTGPQTILELNSERIPRCLSACNAQASLRRS
jgi:hypothetical protein